MSNEQFNGTSQTGDIHEALANAIQTAKVKLRTDFVRWKLLEVHGENGGFILKNELTVTISGKGPVDESEGRQL